MRIALSVRGGVSTMSVFTRPGDLGDVSRQSDLLHIEPSGDGATIMMTFDISLKDGYLPEDLASKVGNVGGALVNTFVPFFPEHWLRKQR